MCVLIYLQPNCTALTLASTTLFNLIKKRLDVFGKLHFFWEIHLHFILHFIGSKNKNYCYKRWTSNAIFTKTFWEFLLTNWLTYLHSAIYSPTLIFPFWRRRVRLTFVTLTIKCQLLKTYSNFLHCNVLNVFRFIQGNQAYHANCT